MMKTTRFYSILVIVACVCLWSPLSAAAQPAPYDGLDAYIEEALAEWEVPGLALAIVDRDGTVYSRGYGVRELGTDAPVDEHTVFLSASTTKAFTAASIGHLVASDRLSWNDRVIDHMPEFRLSDPYVTRNITVRDLLSHRSGLARGDRLWYASPFDREEVMRRMRHLGSSFGFRAGYGYNNNMYITAGELIEAVTDTTWDDFVQSRLLEPLGMDRSSTSIRDLPGDNVASPHARIDGEVEPIPWRDFDNVGAAGAMNASAHDMGRWLRLHLNEGTFDGRRVLDESVVTEMQTPQTAIRPSSLHEELYPETHFRMYGLGWFLQDYRGHQMVEHSGSLDGMRVRVGMLPDEGVGVVILTNMTERYLPAAMLYDVLDRHLGERDRDWSARLLAVSDSLSNESEKRRAQFEEERVEGTTPSRGMPAYVGVYESTPYGEAEVVEDDGALRLSVGPHFTGDMEHWHFDTFRVEWDDPYMGDAFVTFTLDGAGDVSNLRIRNWATFERQEADD